MTIGLLANRYRILALLGSGGFGQTFLAEDIQQPSTPRCVIKQLRPTLGDPNMRQLILERFQREAMALDRLSKATPQVPALFGYFEEAGEFYLVQEWIDGRDLHQIVLGGGPFSEAAVKNMLANLLVVVGYVHAHGIIHRDIKPGNIMIRSRDGMPFLIDFGAVKNVLATTMSTGGGGANTIAIGSPGYMPLEQAAGKPVFASDLFSLGLTAVFLLTGRDPREMIDPLTGEVNWHQYARHVSPAFFHFLTRSIRVNARERYQTARDMYDALVSMGSGPGGTQIEVTSDQRVTAAEGSGNDTSGSNKPTRTDQVVLTSSRVKLLVAGILVTTLLGGIGTWAAWKEYDRRQREQAAAAAAAQQREIERLREEKRKADEAAAKAQREKEEAERKRLEELEKLKPKARILEVRSEHNVTQGGAKGMIIHVKFETNNFQSVACRAVAYFEFSTGTALKDRNERYRTVDGSVSAGEDFTPQYVNATYNDFQIFMPYDEFDLSTGKYDLMYEVQLRKKNGDFIVGSNDVEFTYTYTGKP